GEVGEVVVTSFNPAYPMIRLATGDLSAVMSGASPCGRTNMRIKGWMGRADQTTKVRGMFVHPSQVADVVRRHPEILRARLVISGSTGSDRMVLKVESREQNDDLAKRIADSARDVTKLRADVQWVDEGGLPNDGKVIDDIRKYE
ncbi:MAG: phenylacetate--CoA ligase family protein, partial [Achromobacter mucicolens]